jgi:hypothetical protein
VANQVANEGGQPRWPITVAHQDGRLTRPINTAKQTLALHGKPSPESHYYVYVVELSDKVWNEGRFRRANPDYRFERPCVYVGMTGLDPDLRFDRHKADIQANRYVRDYGLRLMPELYEVFNPMPYDGARDMEVELGIGLREAGYAVWQA